MFHYSFYFKSNSSLYNSSANHAWPPPPSPIANQHEANSRLTNQHDLHSPVSQDRYTGQRTGHFGYTGQSSVSPHSSPGQYSPGGHFVSTRPEYLSPAGNQSPRSPNTTGLTLSRQSSASSNYSRSPGYHEGSRHSPGDHEPISSSGHYGHTATQQAYPTSNSQGHSAYSHLASSCDTSVQNSQVYSQNILPGNSPGFSRDQQNLAGYSSHYRQNYQTSHLRHSPGQGQLQHGYSNEYGSHGNQPGHHGNSYDYQQGQIPAQNNMSHDSYPEYR